MDALGPIQLTHAEYHLVRAFRARKLPRLRSRTAAVYYALLDLMPHGRGDFFTLPRLAEATALHANTVQRGAAELVAAGLVDRHWHGDDRGCLYSLRDP